MKITNIETIQLSIPFSNGTPSMGFGDLEWSRLDTVLVKVETEDGYTGWGDAFSYKCTNTVIAAVEHQVKPIALGQDSRDIAGLSHRLQQQLHLFGRYGATIFALSGLDIALWDIAAKRAGAPLCRLLGGSETAELEAYSSLFKYGDPELVGEKVRESLERGYRYVKLHETGEAEVRAARMAAGDDVPITVDTNCPWTPLEAIDMAQRFSAYDIHWLEEPIFPPEDFVSLARVRVEGGCKLAAGENWCTALQFAQALAEEAVDFVQPSVTKVGGITEFRKVQSLAEGAGIQVMAHSPYFGPGFLATLHLAASSPNPGWTERFYLEVEASLYGDLIDPVDGVYRLPEGPGLGREPDPDVIKDYKVG